MIVHTGSKFINIRLINTLHSKNIFLSLKHIAHGGIPYHWTERELAQVMAARFDEFRIIYERVALPEN